METARLRKMRLALTAAVAASAGGALAYFRPWEGRRDQVPVAKDYARVSDKQGGTLKLKSPLLAESYGIQAEPAREVMWNPRLFVDGRVIANPHAQFEVRAPFAGVVADTDGSVFRLGAAVQARKVLGMLEARFNLLEKLDLKSKRIEAEARYQSAEEVLKIRKDRLDRLAGITASVSLGDFDSAAIQYSEARMTKDTALAQWDLWKRALESADKKSITVPLNAPRDGEITEIGAQPGSYVETGQLLLRVVDFRQVLLRLDFPLPHEGAMPPGEIEVEALAAVLAKPARWRARLRGPAASVEIALQKAGYLYEVVADDGQMSPKWRPGLYVKARFADPAKAPQPAVAIPAAALLVHQGRTLVYIELNVGRYERREVFVLDRDGDTVFVSTQGWTSTTDPVVTRHAQALLSEEFRSDVDDD